MATYEKSFLLSLYRDMVRIRAFEEHAAECFTKGMLAGNIHLSIGQEAAEAGAFAAIEPRDYFTSTHRGHGHAIARGADPKRAMAELFGKETGYCKGKGGSMHIADLKKMNHLGANGIVGAGQWQVRRSDAAIDHAGGHGLKERVASLLARIEAAGGRRMSASVICLSVVSITSLTRRQLPRTPQCGSCPQAPWCALHSVMPNGPSIATRMSARLMRSGARARR